MRRRHRLRNATDFALLRQQGRQFHHPLLVLVIRPNGAAQSRFGFSASRQVGKATSRNRAKRLMRESVRGYLDGIPAGWDCLLIARRGAATVTQDEMNEAVGDTLVRAQILGE